MSDDLSPDRPKLDDVDRRILAELEADGRASVSQNFELTINPVNDAPVLLVPLSDAVSPEDTGFSVSIPMGTFGDVDGDTLTLSATLASGAPTQR